LRQFARDLTHTPRPGRVAVEILSEDVNDASRRPGTREVAAEAAWSHRGLRCHAPLNAAGKLVSNIDDPLAKKCLQIAIILMIYRAFTGD
jgi:hypothetical protein